MRPGIFCARPQIAEGLSSPALPVQGEPKYLHHHDPRHHHHQYIGHIMGGLVTRYQTKKIKFLDFLCSSNFSSIFFRIFSLIPNNASIQEVV